MMVAVLLLSLLLAGPGRAVPSCQSACPALLQVTGYHFYLSIREFSYLSTMFND